MQRLHPIKSAKFTYKLRWFEALLAHAQTLFDAGHPVALIGDFNVVPTDDDIYNPRSWLRDALLQPQSRECYRRLLAQGWLDALRTRRPDGRIYTFWDYFRDHWKRDAGLRIDHLLLSRELAPALRDANVSRWVRDRPHASDHAPTWIELDLPVPSAQRSPRKPHKSASKATARPTATPRSPAGATSSTASAGTEATKRREHEPSRRAPRTSTRRGKK
jgi:exodeoxyribonuclease-3